LIHVFFISFFAPGNPVIIAVACKIASSIYISYIPLKHPFLIGLSHYLRYLRTFGFVSGISQPVMVNDDQVSMAKGSSAAMCSGGFLGDDLGISKESNAILVYTGIMQDNAVNRYTQK
jgi:hypothetical protein